MALVALFHAKYISPRVGNAPGNCHVDFGRARAMLYDMHCHLDFCPEPAAYAQTLERADASALSMTVDPRDYATARERLAGCANVRVGLGLHPWWVRNAEQAALLAESLVEQLEGARLVGEVGLDLGPRHIDTAGPQLETFERVMRACATIAPEGAAISLHAVNAVDEVLDVLGRTGCLTRHTCILHWFSGTSDQLWHAVDAGCLFSLGELSLRTRKGREYARILPAERLLLETDLPPEQGEEFAAEEHVDSLERGLAGIAKARAIEPSVLAETLAVNSARVFERLG